MNLTMVGTGYVGLVTGTCLADVGNCVLCYDTDKDKIKTLQDGGMPIHEPGLHELVRRNVAAGRLAFSNDADHAVAHSPVQFLAVGTPPNEDGAADLQYILSAAKAIGKRICEPLTLVIKSTVPVGTADKIRTILAKVFAERGVALSFSVISNPEFLKEGAAVEDFMRPDRIILGIEKGDEEALALMRALYAPFQRNHNRLIVSDPRSAELTKYAANAMLATRISFMNELANLAEKLGADIELVRQGIGSDPRIGYDFLYSGCGYGGSCFPKDVKALIMTAKDNAHMVLEVLTAVEKANETQKHVLGQKIKAHFGTDLSGRSFGLWGLAFKPNTDDMREASSRVLIADLLAAGARIKAYDPIAMAEARRVFAGTHGLDYANNPLEAAQNADALVIVTEWKEFRSPNFSTLKATLKQPLIFDGRNLYDPALMHKQGFTYHAIGRSVAAGW